MSEEILNKRSKILENILEDGLEKALIGIKLIDEKNGPLPLSQIKMEEIQVHKREYNNFLKLSKEAGYNFEGIEEKYKGVIQKYELN